MSNRGSLLVRAAMLALVLTGISSCSGGGIGLPPLRVVLFNFAPGFAGVHLNAPLELTFSTDVDPDSVTQDSIRIFTTTTSTTFPDPGAPAIGRFDVQANVVRFLPRVPCLADLTDSGLRIGFQYTIQVPASPDVIQPVRTNDGVPGGIDGDPNVQSFTEFFTTLNQTILPAPADITAEPNLVHLSRFFVDEGIENGIDPVDRSLLPPADRDSPQVVDTDPNEGESGFGTITGIQAGLGTAFVRLDPITLIFSEPISPWRVREENITIRNTNLGGETFDLFFFFTCGRGGSEEPSTRLQITVFDADSAFDQASVPQGRYSLVLTAFTDLAGNPLVNSLAVPAVADGTFELTFSTVSSPSLPTDLKVTFQDDDQDGHVDVGGLRTPTRNPNEFHGHVQPFLGGMANDRVPNASLSSQTTTANWGDTALFNGCEIQYDNGYDPLDLVDFDRPIPQAVRLRGGTRFGATAILCPFVGDAAGPTDNVSGTQDGIVQSPTEAGKLDFVLTGNSSIQIFTGSAATGPILYHYNSFRLEETAGGRPTITALQGSIYPLIIFVEDDALIAGNIILDGANGEFGFNGANDQSHAGLSRNVGGRGGAAVAGGGAGGNGGSAVYGDVPSLVDGVNGSVPVNVLGPVDALSEAVAGLTNMGVGGGGRYDETQPQATVEPVYIGGGGGSHGSGGTQGADSSSTPTPGVTNHGRGGVSYGTHVDFSSAVVGSCGGAGGGGGGADDDQFAAGATANQPDNRADTTDDGGGGGGAGGGFFGLFAGGDIRLGIVEPGADPDMPNDDVLRFARIRCVGGRGGSTYATVAGDPPVPGTVPGTPNETSPIGQGEAGGGGGGGGICLGAVGQIRWNVAELYVWGKPGGNTANFEGRAAGNAGGSGGGGLIFCQDSNGVDGISELGAPFGSNRRIQIIPDVNRDLDFNGTADLVAPGDNAIIRDLNEMSLAGSTNAAAFAYAVYGDGVHEPLFGTTQIVTEFFDTLSDTVSYDEVRILSNAPRWGYSVGTPASRVIRVFLDTTISSGGFPDLSSENPVTGALLPPTGGTLEIGQHFNQDTGVAEALPRFDSRFIIPPGPPTQGKRFARIRIIFDLALVGTPTALLDTFARRGALPVPIADDPATLGVIENTLGNIDQAPAGVPAVADVRVRFTP